MGRDPITVFRIPRTWHSRWPAHERSFARQVSERVGSILGVVMGDIRNLYPRGALFAHRVQV